MIIIIFYLLRVQIWRERAKHCKKNKIKIIHQTFHIIIIFISLSMSLTGLSVEMYIFHFEAISLSTHISGSKRPIFTNLDSLERPWPTDGS
jgi:hypothetical protein